MTGLSVSRVKERGTRDCPTAFVVGLLMGTLQSCSCIANIVRRDGTALSFRDAAPDGDQQKQHKHSLTTQNGFELLEALKGTCISVCGVGVVLIQQSKGVTTLRDSNSDENKL